MTIASEITRIKTNIASAYTALEEKGAVIPEVQNSDNLPEAISSISNTGAATGTMREFWAVPNSYLQLDNEMTNDARLVSLRTRIDQRMSSFGCAFLPVAGNSITVTYNSGVRAIRTSDGAYYELTSGQTLTHTWDSTMDAEDGYRWIIYYFVDGYTSSTATKSEFGTSATAQAGTFYTSSETSNSNAYGQLYRYAKYLVINAYIRYTNLFNDWGSSVNGLDSFRTIGDGFIAASTVSTFNFYQVSSRNLKYFPSIEDGLLTIEDGYVITKDNTPTSSSYYLKNYPKGLDLSGVTDGSWDLTNLYNCLTSLYVKIPPVDIILSMSTSARDILLSKTNWQYIADNAPTVEAKTLTMGNINIKTCGGEDSEIITTLKNKGWTIA